MGHPGGRMIAQLAVVCLALVGLLKCGASSGPTGTTGTGVRLVEVASGLSNPLYLTAPKSDPRQFVVEQPGRIRVISNGALLTTPFIDLTSKVLSGGERGLLSVAFHPSYSTNGFFYVNYTDRNGDTRVERYHVSANANVADPASVKLILMVPQPFANHNGGLVLFGQDGMLYIGMGDGGSGGDPNRNGQNPNALLGKLLRIDVDRGDPYAIPADNPYASGTGGRGEVWAIGLRNPWRFSFDRTANALYIADVGQDAYEEINAVTTSAKGLNYGWNIMEGLHCYGASSCNQAGLTLPVLEYSHSQGCSITGGLVYRGTSLPAIVGQYFYGDYCQGWIRSIKITNGALAEQNDWTLGSIGSILSFGEDSSGEMYVMSDNGKVYKFAPLPATP
jgi:glucose/arabinose dehydrogenase